jgi:hypothetical protein
MVTCYTDQTPSTLPNTQDLAVAIAEMQAVCDSLMALQWRVQRIAREAQVDDDPGYALVDGDEIPTFAHIGEFAVFAFDARSHLEEASGYLSGFETLLSDLNAVRSMHQAG